MTRGTNSKGLSTSPPLLDKEPTKKNKNYIKIKVKEPSLILGKDIKLNNISKMEESTVVGQLVSKRMLMEILRSYTEENFTLLLGYMPRCMILVKGWLGQIIASREDAQKILHRHYKWGTQALFIKKQMISLDAFSNNICMVLLWPATTPFLFSVITNTK